MKLGYYTFPYDPPAGEYSGVNWKKSRSEMKTFDRNITVNWGFVLSDTRITMQWDIIDIDFYTELRARFLANNGSNVYTFVAKDNMEYEVEIVSFAGTPYDFFFDPRVGREREFYKNAKLELKILNQS
jgi:hypothetical protein